MIPLEVRVNKEVRNYQEGLFFGLSLRQLVFALLAVGVAVGVYFALRGLLGTGEIGWVCVLAAFPFAIAGFFQYNGMTFERFVLAMICSQLLTPARLVFRVDNLYAKILAHSSVKEALNID
nr:PrgI family protein [Pseudoflavonifractor phocaeensis]